jgi:hypothetical protein
MTSHQYRLIEMHQAKPATGMRYLDGVFTQRFNHLRGRGGRMFQSRYKALQFM